MKPSLRYKVISIVLLAAIPFIIYAVIHYITTVNESKRAVIARNLDKAEEIGHEMDEFIDNSQNILYSLALHPALINKDATACDNLFNQLINLYPMHLNLLAADMEGRNFASAIIPEPAHKLQHSGKEWFVRGSKGVSVVTDLHVSKLFQQPSFMITMPVFSNSGNQTAILGFPVNLLKLREHFIEIEGMSKNSTLSIFDNNGIILLCTADESATGKPCKLIPILQEIAKNKSGSLVNFDSGGVKHFYSYATVSTTGWKVLYGVPASDVYTEANQGARRHLILFSLVCLAAGLSTYYYSRKLAAKVEVLIDGLNDVAAGNFDRRLSIPGNDEITQAGDAFNRMTAERQKAEQEISGLAMELEKRVELRTAELTTAKNELEAFSYAVSHDLQAPVRHILSYSQILMDGNSQEFSETSRDYLQRINRSGLHMRELITHLLSLSRINRQELNRTTVDLSALAEKICHELAEADNDRQVQVAVAAGLTITADAALLEIAMHNLIENAWKYTRKVAAPRIDIGKTSHNGRHCFFVRDNGTGFDMADRDKLFVPFQRLHTNEEFEGNGVGLATVMRIVRRHDGSIWAESTPGGGAVFYFTLGS